MIGNFRVPISNGSSGSSYLSTTPQTYTRPADWLSLPSVISGDQKFVGLYSIYDNDSNFCALQCASNYTVDWGDGTSNNYSANVSAYHVYGYNYAGFVGTESSYGYRQAVVTITPQATFNLTKVDLNIKHNQTGLPAYTSNWLDICLAGQFISSLFIGGANVPPKNLEIFEFVGTNVITNLSNCFLNAHALKWFKGMYTNSVTNMTTTFSGCYALQSIPLLNTANVTIMNGTFTTCYNLLTIPLLNTNKVTIMQSMFLNCTSLVSVPLLDTALLQDSAIMFQGCISLITIPLFNTISLTNAYSMFQGCVSLKEVPLFNTSSVIACYNMFLGCSSLQSIPFFDTGNCTVMNSFLEGCSLLQTIPFFNTINAISMPRFFYGCKSLQTVPLLNTSKVTDMTSMFGLCYFLRSVPLFDTALVTGMSGMFSFCLSLRTVPLFNIIKVNNMNSMFQYCYALQELPNFNFIISANTGYMFYNCYNLTSIPNYNGSFISTYDNTFAICTSLSRIRITNIGSSINIASAKMSKNAILEVFGNLKTAVAQTITVTGNWGADTAVSKASCGTTAESAVVTQSNTASLAVGMLVLGTGISTSRAVSFQDTGDTVTLNAHGLVNGNIVSFPSITTTTGIVISKPYYVVGATTNTFQVSLTLGGSAIALATDGSGTVAYGSYIQSIITNTSFTLDKPASVTGTVTLTARILDTSIATLKGWTVTG